MIVHVMAGTDETMASDGALCTERRDAEVVYHVRSVEEGTGFTCLDCGVSITPERERAMSRARRSLQ